MDSILIVGTETVVGANLAITLSDRHDVVGLSTGAPVPLDGCRTAHCPPREHGAADRWVASERPGWVIFCGTAARSTWEPSPLKITDRETERPAEQWARAATDNGARFAMVSSDAVFTGPWMFHAEDCQSLCSSRSATTLRALEERILSVCPQALIVRTNAFGWKPASAGPGWIEQLCETLETGTAGQFDHVRHATPILATDLAEILESACRENLCGIYHIAGAERISPDGFVRKIADRFGLPAPSPQGIQLLSGPQTGFGCGETSLRTARIRAALQVNVPTLDEGIDRLFEQRANGYCDRLNGAGELVREKVA